MVDKKAVAIATIIAVIIVGVVLGLRIINLNKYENKENNETKMTQNATSSKVQENEIANSSAKNTSENEAKEDNGDTSKTDSNEENSNKSKTNSNSGNSGTSKINSSEKDPEKLAISLAKEKWGNKNSNVYFDVEDKNEKKGIYTIVVRDSNTTIEMTTYKVDVNKKTVTE